MPIEPGSLVREPVEIRCFDRSPVAAEVVAQIVGDGEEHIWRVRMHRVLRVVVDQILQSRDEDIDPFHLPLRGHLSPRAKRLVDARVG